jgi:hypothetical protein
MDGFQSWCGHGCIRKMPTIGRNLTQVIHPHYANSIMDMHASEAFFFQAVVITGSRY